MLDLDQPVQVNYRGKSLFSGAARATIATLARSLDKRGDPKLMFDAEIEVAIPEK